MQTETGQCPKRSTGENVALGPQKASFGRKNHSLKFGQRLPPPVNAAPPKESLLCKTAFLLLVEEFCPKVKGFPIKPADDLETFERMLRLLLLFELRFPSVPTGGKEKLRELDERLDERPERTDLQTIVVVDEEDSCAPAEECTAATPAFALMIGRCMATSAPTNTRIMRPTPRYRAII